MQRSALRGGAHVLGDSRSSEYLSSIVAEPRNHLARQADDDAASESAAATHASLCTPSPVTCCCFSLLYLSASAECC